MDYKTISLDEIKITGIETRTDNNTAHADISNLWQKFFSENIQQKIMNKKSEDILSLYTEYESDFTKPYTVVIGCKVKNFSNIPEGMVSKAIPAAKYAVFNSKGTMPDEIIKTWQLIWNADINRTYAGDFELYTEKYFQNPPEVDIYIAIK